jgi:hypothetical protein
VLTEPGSLCVAVANDDKLPTSSCCGDMEIAVHGERFRIDCYGLSLGSYDMVLGVK